MGTIKRSMLAGCAGAAMLAIGVTAALPQPGFSPIDRSNPGGSGQDGNLRPHPTPPLATEYVERMKRLK